MKLIYKGKFDGNTDALPCNPHKSGAVKYKEMDDVKKFGVIMNIVAIVIMAIFIVGIYFRANNSDFDVIGIGSLMALLTLVPHEILHATVFKGEVYFYHDLKNGLMFVTGLEEFSKGRFIFMSMLPNLVFGIVPYILFLINPNLMLLGSLGAVAIGMGAGDYYNVYNTLTQVPKGAKVYMHKFNTYWYLPEKE